MSKELKITMDVFPEGFKITFKDVDVISNKWPILNQTDPFTTPIHWHY